MQEKILNTKNSIELVPGKLYKIVDGGLLAYPVPYNYNSFCVGINEVFLFVKKDNEIYPNYNSCEYAMVLIKGKLCQIYKSNILYATLEML